MLNLTLEDAKQAIHSMEKNKLIQMKETIKLIPIIGSDLYLQALFEEKKIEIFKKLLEQAINNSPIEQQEFLDEFGPLILENTKQKQKRKHL